MSFDSYREPRDDYLMNANDFRRRREAAGISGATLCLKANILRSRLTAIERGYTQPSQDFAERLEQALTDLVEAKQQVIATAQRCGWPVSALFT